MDASSSLPTELPRLRGSSVVLRAFDERDVDLVVSVADDPLIPLVTTVPTSGSGSDAAAFIERQHARLATGAGYSFAIADTQTDEAVGQIGLWLGDIAEGRATTGYWIAPQFRCRGYARFHSPLCSPRRGKPGTSGRAKARDRRGRHDGGMVARNAGDVRSVEELVKFMQSGSQPKFLFFCGHKPRPDGRLGSSCLSQWWPARFEADGQEFASAEHYMMWRKALLFGDQRRADAILQARSPAHAKEIGRAVEGFEESTWVANRWEIVVAASVAKFDSDPGLRSFLLGTSKRVLVEASPKDRIWGIGLTQDSEFAEVPQQWPGLNLLGFALMEARDRLAKADVTAADGPSSETTRR